ncbi:unnamed protein product [Amaranthus hypochondriacus]
MGPLETWVEVESLQFDPIAIKLAWELVYKKVFQMKQDIGVIEENTTKLAKVLDIYESHLAHSKYLGGEIFTLADLHHLPILYYLTSCKELQIFRDRPHVSAWCKDILSRPAWEMAVNLNENLKK